MNPHLTKDTREYNLNEIIFQKYKHCETSDMHEARLAQLAERSAVNR